MQGRLTIAVTKFSENLQENCFKVADQQISINGHELFSSKVAGNNKRDTTRIYFSL